MRPAALKKSIVWVASDLSDYTLSLRLRCGFLNAKLPARPAIQRCRPSFFRNRSITSAPTRSSGRSQRGSARAKRAARSFLVPLRRESALVVAGREPDKKRCRPPGARTAGAQVQDQTRDSREIGKARRVPQAIGEPRRRNRSYECRKGSDPCRPPPPLTRLTMADTRRGADGSRGGTTRLKRLKHRLKFGIRNRQP